MTPNEPDWATAVVTVECPRCGKLWCRALTWATRGAADARTACCGKRLRAFPERLAATFAPSRSPERRA